MDPWVECEEIKSIVQEGNTVRKVGFGFRDVRLIILLEIFLPGQFLRLICLDAKLGMFVGVNVVKI